MAACLISNAARQWIAADSLRLMMVQGPRGLIRWREMGADVEWTDKGPMVSFTLYRLRSLHDSYRGPPVQLHPT